MPKRNTKNKARDPPSAAGDSSDEDQDARHNVPRQAEADESRKKDPFDKGKILLAILGREAPGAKPDAKNGCMQHLPAFFPDEVKQEWLNWAENTPATLSEVPEEHRLRQCKMPMKCLPASEAQVAVPRVQREIIRYTNADGRSVNQAVLCRDADALKQMVEGDLTIDSTVALNREKETEGECADGYGTPFYLGDATAIEYESAASSSAMDASASASAARAPRKIKSFTVHYRMPLLRGRFSNDVTRP